MLRRILALTSVLTTAAIAGAACAPGDGAASADDDLSAVRQAQMATRVYRKLLGRDPTPADVGQLRSASLAQMVDTVLASPEFDRDGFFNFQRDRLLLHRDGDDAWLQSSLNDYCALKLDMEDVARSDADGPGYYEILRYRDRWLPLTSNSVSMSPSCFTMKVGPFRAAVAALPPIDDGGGFGDFGDFEGEEGDLPENDPPPPPRTEAETCADSIAWRDDFRAEIAALDPSLDDTPFIETAVGRRLLLASLRESTFSRESGDGLDFEEPNAPMPNAPPVEIELADDAQGRPQLRRFDGSPSDRCQTTDALAAPVAPGAVLYAKVRVPADIEGVHGSQYWLSRHPSTKKNRDLHRARMIFFSYMCTEVSPAMAAASGGDPQPIAELEPYFAPDDQHVRTSANCYNCHTQVQPVANYFGETSKGTSYSSASEFTTSAFYAASDGFRRPGGLWKGEAFHPRGAGMFGMEGLAELLSNLDASHDCVARNAWASLVGSGYALTDDERSGAVSAFKDTGAFRFKKLLRHLIVDNPRGKAYFEGGEAALAALEPGTSADCRDVASVPDDARSAPESVLGDACAGCHSGNNTRGFFQRAADGSRVWAPERLVGSGLRYGNEAELYDRLYCKVWSGDMPMGGWDDEGGDGSAKKKQALCYFGGKRNEAARASTDPAVRAFDSKPCDGQLPTPSRQPHPIEPTP